MTSLPFDTVILREPGKPEQSLTPEQFLELPLYDRVRVVLRKELHFTRNGESVDKEFALQSMAQRKVR